MAVFGRGGDAPHLDMKPRGGIKCRTVVFVKTMILGSTMEWYRGVNVFVLNTETLGSCSKVRKFVVLSGIDRSGQLRTGAGEPHSA